MSHFGVYSAPAHANAADPQSKNGKKLSNYSTSLDTYKVSAIKGMGLPPKLTIQSETKGTLQAPLQFASQSTSELVANQFDSIISDMRTKPMHTALEFGISSLFKANQVVLWLNNPSRNFLFSPKLQKYCNYNSSIVGNSFTTNSIIRDLHPQSNEKFDSQIDPVDSSVLVFPLQGDDGRVLYVVQCMRSFDRTAFTQEDENLALLFAQRFYNFSFLLAPNMQVKSVSCHLVNPSDPEHLAHEVTDRLKRHFWCKSVEFWMKTLEGTIMKYDLQSHDFLHQETKLIGSILPALKSGTSTILEDITKSQGYIAEIDGGTKESLLCVPIQIEDKTYFISVKGKKDGSSFTEVDVQQLEHMAPLIIRCLYTQKVSSFDFAARLKALLEVAEILSGVLDIDSLIPTILERACALLKTERCSLFLIDQQKQELVSRFQGGLDQQIRIPIGKGIVGHTATTGNIVNITDAYSDPRFDNAIDISTGFQTRTILSVPIYNNRGEIVGVTEMINRIDGSAFDDDDIKMMMAFNVFCGISLDNAKLYQTSLDLTRQLRGFVEMSSALNKTRTITTILEEILTNARNVIHASRATIFLLNPDGGGLAPFVTIGSEIVHGTIFADESSKTLKTRVFSQDDVSALSGGEEITSNSGDTTSSSRSSLSRVSSVLSLDSPKFTDPPLPVAQFDSLCEFPLITNDHRLIGVMELSFTWKILPEDIKLLECFAVFATVSLEKSELEDIAKYGYTEIKLKKWINHSERKGYSIPENLIITEDDGPTIFTNEFNSPKWEGIGHFKVIWAIFNRFDLLREFKITNEKFFNFLTSISQTYNSVPYHNWRHAVDVTQFVSYQVILGKCEKTFPKLELLALLVSAICHDANHDGFSNTYNVKAETPLGILFKSQSVMETHHAETSINIISKEENNIFSDLNPADYKKVWTMIIQLILATDMAKHHDLLKAMSDLLDSGKFSLENPDHRLLIMQELLKCADISNVSRPFELADKWCDILCAEFFRQGDLEKTNGMEFTSPLNDREHSDKAKSQIGFYTFVCLPLFKVTEKAIPELKANTQQVESNLARWKEQADAKAKSQCGK